jgi:hypothetical protein
VAVKQVHVLQELQVLITAGLKEGMEEVAMFRVSLPQMGL